MNYFKRFQAFIGPALVAGLSAAMLFSCAKIESEPIVSNHDSVYSAQQSFAAILSEAVSETPSLRSFIRETALEQFDNDYDVFYPYVKNTVVENNLTFRDLLLQHTDEQTLSSIEQALPKLTILVPDWSWMGCFSIHSWDPAEDVSVTFAVPDGYIGAYEKGEYLGELPDGSFPDFPVLVIKENERMVYSPGTKGSNGGYDFADAAFDNVHTKVTHQYSEEIIDGTPDISNFVPEAEVNYRVREAFSYFSGSNAIYQRDYLYYNMTAPNQTKVRNENIQENVYKFKFQDYTSSFMHDDTNYDLAEYPASREYVYQGYKASKKTPAELRKIFYANGKLDLMFLISIPTKSGSVFTTTKTKSVSFGDVFAIDHADLDYRHRTLLNGNKDKYTYTVKAEYIKPRWCVLNWDLPRWDISQESTMITINVTEFDETGSSEITYTTKNTVTDNFKIDGEVPGIPIVSGITAKVGLGYNHTESTETTETKTYKRNQGGIDNLGQAEWDYLTPIALNRVYKNGKWGYEIKTISTGTVDLMILPTSY